MEIRKLKILINLFSASSEKVAIVDGKLNVLWTNDSTMPKMLKRTDFLNASDEQHFGYTDQDYDLIAEFPIKTEKVLKYDTEQFVSSVNVLPVFDDENSENIEGYVMTFHRLFEEIEKHINSPFTVVLKKFLRMLRNTASEVVFNTGLIDQRLEDLEEYDLIDKNANINNILNNALSSCANFEEIFIYGANDFNVILANASEFVTDLIHFVEHSARKMSVKISYEIQDDIYLKLDYSRFMVAAMNLISNGIKYNLSDKKMIFVEFKRVDNYACFTVTDNGIGIPNERAYKIFEPFSNVNKSGQRESLGLSIVKKFVDKFGGAISFQTDTSGTSFTLKLPCADDIDVNEVNVPNTDYFKGTYSPIDIYLLKADTNEDID